MCIISSCAEMQQVFDSFFIVSSPIFTDALAPCGLSVEKQVGVIVTSYRLGRCLTPYHLFITTSTAHAEGNPPLRHPHNVSFSFKCTLLKGANFSFYTYRWYFLESWRTEDKDRRSRRLWCSPLYPFSCYERHTRFNYLLHQFSCYANLLLVIHFR